MFFYDLDFTGNPLLISQQILETTQLLNRHDCWYRLSSSKKGMHVISEEPITVHLRGMDGRYTGNLFFNNKGDKWTSSLWINGRRKETRFFKPTLIIMATYIRSNFEYDYITETLPNRFRNCTISFHSIIVNGELRRKSFTQVSRSADYSPYHMYVPYNADVTDKLTYNLLYQQFMDEIPNEHRIETHIDELTQRGDMPKINGVLL